MKKVFFALMAVCLISAIQLKNTQAQVLEETQKLLPAGVRTGDTFGYSICFNDDYLMIGAPYTDDWQGAVYVLKNESGEWVVDTRLEASDAEDEDIFGVSIDISGDYMIIGAHCDDEKGYNAGAAYIFKNEGGNWNEVAKLTADDGEMYDWFGISVGIYDNYAVVGAHGDDDNGEISGSAYIFQNIDGTWTQIDKIIASDGSNQDRFGSAVGIFDGLIVVGAFYHGDNGMYSSGSVYLFEDTGAGWNQIAKFTASDGASGDHFGRSLDINNGIIAISSYMKDDNTGSAYIFEEPADGWQDMNETYKLVASDGIERDFFGLSICIGVNRVIIGAPKLDYNQFAGCAYIFDKVGDEWNEIAKLEASDGQIDERFGYSVGILGNNAFVGAIYDNDGGGHAGSAYVFDLNQLGVSSSVQQEISIVPNPASDMLYFQGFENKNGILKIIDVTGRNIIDTEFEKLRNINVSNFKSGLYIVRVEIDNEVYNTKIVIE